MTINGYVGTFWGEGNVVKRDRWWPYNCINSLKLMKLYS